MTKLTYTDFSSILASYGNPSDISTELAKIIDVIYGQIEGVTHETPTGTAVENSVCYRSVSRYISQRITHSRDVAAGRPSTPPFFGLTNGEKEELKKDPSSDGRQRFYPVDIGWAR